jgi:hypothetical protein
VVVKLKDESVSPPVVVKEGLPKIAETPTGSPVSPLPVAVPSVTVQAVGFPFRFTVTVP